VRWQRFQPELQQHLRFQLVKQHFGDQTQSHHEKNHTQKGTGQFVIFKGIHKSPVSFAKAGRAKRPCKISFVLCLLVFSRNTYKPWLNETFCHFSPKAGGNSGDMF
jgi:hypothetical protein